MVGRKAAKVRVAVDIGDANRDAIPGNVTQRADRSGVAADSFGHLLRHTQDHPGIERLVGIGAQADGHVFGAGQRLCLERDRVQDRRDVRDREIRHRLRDLRGRFRDPLEIGAKLSVGFLRARERRLGGLLAQVIAVEADGGHHDEQHSRDEGQQDQQRGDDVFVVPAEVAARDHQHRDRRKCRQCQQQSAGNQASGELGRQRWTSTLPPDGR